MRKSRLMEKKCAECSSVFHRYASQLVGFSNVFCSNGCRYTFERKRRRLLSADKNTQLQRFFKNVKKADNGCWEWTGSVAGVAPMQYAKFSINRTSLRAHRWIYEVTNNVKIREGMYLCHSCDNTICVNPAHLFQGTAKDNMQDCAKKGRLPQATISDELIRLIQSQYVYGSGYNLAKKYKVSRSTITRIIHKQNHEYLWSSTSA